MEHYLNSFMQYQKKKQLVNGLRTKNQLIEAILNWMNKINVKVKVKVISYRNSKSGKLILTCSVTVFGQVHESS